MVQAIASGSAAPPPFLRLAGHPLRWRLLRELAHSDLRVAELCRVAGERQSLVSYHMRQLRDGGLVRARRSTADGRDSYYALDLARCRSLLAGAGASLHPGLTAISGAPTRTAIARVLFLCTGNSARSQIAEALAEQLSDGTVRAVSAGSAPKALHPNAVRVMRDRGVDISDRQAKHLDRFTGQRFDYVISLCDRVREVCPEFPGSGEVVHWSVPDPNRAPGGYEQTLPIFASVADELTTRISFLLDAINHPKEISDHDR